eukprot:PLAT12238.1.p1 GENE.PLAT12238.1~~PLAT12238.1.p1  ORF type:complete len:486 (+),score=177.69 PLAT12238.1:40-1458(+)
MLRSRLVPVVLTGAGAGLLAACDWLSPAAAEAEKPAAAESTWRERFIGHYENRLRYRSTPEKVFEYFASVEKAGALFMTPANFIRALTPFQEGAGAEVGSPNTKFNTTKWFGPSDDDVAASTSWDYRAAFEHLRAADGSISAEAVVEIERLRRSTNPPASAHLRMLEHAGVSATEYEAALDAAGMPSLSRFMELVDTDGDGLISFGEYLFFCTVLSIPAQQFTLAFRMLDENGDGTIDAAEFEQVMSIMRARTPAGKQVRNIGLDGRKRGADAYGMSSRFFGADGSGSLTPSKFKAFVDDLRSEVLRLEFFNYDRDHAFGLSEKEFGMFLVAHTPESHTKQVMERTALLSDESGNIQLDEFMAFNNFLQNLDEMEVAMKLTMTLTGRDGLTKAEFLRAAAAATAGKSKLTEAQVNVLFTLFDRDGDGLVNATEFVDVMGNVTSRGMDRERDMGVMAMFDKIVACARSAELIG